MKRNGAVQKTDGMNSNGPVNRVRIDGFRAIINGSGIQVSGPFFLDPMALALPMRFGEKRLSKLRI